MHKLNFKTIYNMYFFFLTKNATVADKQLADG